MPWYEDKDNPGTYFIKVNYKDHNGEYKQLLRRTYKGKKITSKKDAKAALTELENEVLQGTYIKPSNTLYKDFMADWLEDKKSRVKKGTYQNYSALVNNHILPMRKNAKDKTVGLGSLKLENITPRHIQDLYNYLTESASLADENIQKCHTIINESLKRAKAWKMISDNPAELVDRPTARKTEMQVWSLEESQQFLKAAEKDPLYIVFLLALTTGMRQGEILGLRWKDVDKVNRILSVTQILSHDGKELEPGAKTTSGERPIRIDEHTMNALEAHRKKTLEKRVENADVYEDKGLVVHTKFGKPVTPRNVTRSFKRIIKAAGLREIRFHDLRHTHVTFLIKNRESAQAIAERLGWSDTRMIDKYAHIRPDIQEDVAETFGKVFYMKNVT